MLYEVGQLQADAYLDKIEKIQLTKDSLVIFILIQLELAGTRLKAQYDNQKKIVQEDWDKARNNPNQVADPLNQDGNMGRISI